MNKVTKKVTEKEVTLNEWVTKKNEVEKMKNQHLKIKWARKN